MGRLVRGRTSLSVEIPRGGEYSTVAVDLRKPIRRNGKQAQVATRACTHCILDLLHVPPFIDSSLSGRISLVGRLLLVVSFVLFTSDLVAL